MTAVEMACHSQVLLEDKSNVRILTLNRPKVLNALCFDMISRLMQLFLAYEEDLSVKLVILKGQGRAFCAGGDVRPVIRDIVREVGCIRSYLCRVGSSDPVTFASAILNAYTQHPHVKQHSAYHRLDVIGRCFSRRTVGEIIPTLERPLRTHMNGSQLPFEL